MKSIRIISITSYFLIILAGQMIGLPFICWLLFTVFDFGNIDQIFAICGIVGISLNFTKWKNNIGITILSFFLMLSPLISRIVQVPIKMFNYLSFEIPLTIFIIGYFTFIFLNAKKKLQLTRYC
ncbi:Uncharacterised protein [Algoriella xinjiangensis]|uniref:hypothetical protein n=1 Tax=Algoriella xinjiangensis TaxID=684065 RepID=UPI000F6445D0|nr:hypothetical protein [Algoriella xinjiangensis]VDH15465.1 Uncharacterised protein [Algoriella xinjiangensis]